MIQMLQCQSGLNHLCSCQGVRYSNSPRCALCSSQHRSPQTIGDYTQKTGISCPTSDLVTQAPASLPEPVLQSPHIHDKSCDNGINPLNSLTTGIPSKSWASVAALYVSKGFFLRYPYLKKIFLRYPLGISERKCVLRDLA